jgi:hypothetical protein
MKLIRHLENEKTWPNIGEVCAHHAEPVPATGNAGMDFVED